jgi:hypothetical protein
MAGDAEEYEVQLEAMRLVIQALKPLNDEGREAVLTWVDSQFGRRAKPTPAGPSQPVTDGAAANKREGTVSMVSQKIGAKSARDLLLAAATHLTLFQGKESFSKEELIACAKDARGWKSAYSNQMAVNIGRMIKADILFEKSKNLFSLSQSSEAEMQAKLSA